MNVNTTWMNGKLLFLENCAISMGLLLLTLFGIALKRTNKSQSLIGKLIIYIQILYSNA